MLMHHALLRTTPLTSFPLARHRFLRSRIEVFAGDQVRALGGGLNGNDGRADGMSSRRSGGCRVVDRRGHGRTALREREDAATLLRRTDDGVDMGGWEATHDVRPQSRGRCVRNSPSGGCGREISANLTSGDDLGGRGAGVPGEQREKVLDGRNAEVWAGGQCFGAPLLTVGAKRGQSVSSLGEAGMYSHQGLVSAVHGG